MHIFCTTLLKAAYIWIENSNIALKHTHIKIGFDCRLQQLIQFFPPKWKQIFDTWMFQLVLQTKIDSQKTKFLPGAQTRSTQGSPGYPITKTQISRVYELHRTVANSSPSMILQFKSGTIVIPPILWYHSATSTTLIKQDQDQLTIKLRNSTKKQGLIRVAKRLWYLKNIDLYKPRLWKWSIRLIRLYLFQKKPMMLVTSQVNT